MTVREVETVLDLAVPAVAIVRVKTASGVESALVLIVRKEVTARATAVFRVVDAPDPNATAAEGALERTAAEEAGVSRRPSTTVAQVAVLELPALISIVRGVTTRLLSLFRRRLLRLHQDQLA